MRLTFLILLLLPCCLAATEVYKTVKPDGTTSYTDQPTEDAKTITIEPAPTVPPLRSTTRPSQTPSQAPAQESRLQSVSILSPGADSVIRNNAGDITIEVRTKPPLQPADGHRLQVVLDGQRLEPRYSASPISLSNVDRGTHVLQVLVVDGDGKILSRSDTVSFHLLRHSILHP